MIEWKFPVGQPKTTYVIATNPRTGSWLLADCLDKTGVAGKPGEWFSRLEEIKIRKAFPALNYEEYVKFVCAQSCTTNGVSAIKMHRHDFDILSGKLMEERESMRCVADVLGDAKWIYLTRQDKARQAISYVLARATHEWWRTKDQEQCFKDVEYDEYAIRQAEEELEYLDGAWDGWFIRNGIEPLRLVYEHDLEHNETRTTRRVLNELGIYHPAEIAPSNLVRQANARNEEWLERYRG